MIHNHGLFSARYLDSLRTSRPLDDAARARLKTFGQSWRQRQSGDRGELWTSFVQKALGYLEFAPMNRPLETGLYPLFEDFGYANQAALLFLVAPGHSIDETAAGLFAPGKLIRALRTAKRNWGVVTDGTRWRLFSTKSSRPYEDYLEADLGAVLEAEDEPAYALFEKFFHRDAFLPQESEENEDEDRSGTAVYTCRLDADRAASEEVLDRDVKSPLLFQVDEALQYLCNGFIHDTGESGEAVGEETRREIFESAVKLLYRCLFFFYAESRHLLPSEEEKRQAYDDGFSMQALCRRAHDYNWGRNRDPHGYDFWQHLQGLTHAVSDGDPEYGVHGYNGGLFDDTEERFLARHRLRNDFLARALYLLSYVEPVSGERDDEYPIPFEDLEVRHLGELYENILEFNVTLADADLIRRRVRRAGRERVQTLPAEKDPGGPGGHHIRKGTVYFGESPLERKQSGSYYTPETLVDFLNRKSIVDPLRVHFERAHRARYDGLLQEAREGIDAETRAGAGRSARILVERFAREIVLAFRICDPAMGSGHFLVNAANQMAGLIVDLLSEIPEEAASTADPLSSEPNHWRRLITRRCLYGVDLNPLAVNLAKLSLWLNGFARTHKLTFLDPHLKCGNSLIGLRDLRALAAIPERRKDRKRDRDESPELELATSGIEAPAQAAAGAMAGVLELDEDATEAQKEQYDAARRDLHDALAPFADTYTAYLMLPGMKSVDYGTLLNRIHLDGWKSAADNWDVGDWTTRITDLACRHHFFHWPLEFPEVFASGDGFDATVGNPPWDTIKPLTQEFFSRYEPDFRTLKKQEAIKKADELRSNNPAIAEAWVKYEELCREQSEYFTGGGAYHHQGKGDINTYKLFLEGFFLALREGGRLGIVCPSGLYTDAGCEPLRRLFLGLSRIRFLYGFENRWPSVFPAVDNRFKFVLFGTEKGGATDSFRAAFMQHNPERLEIIERDAAEISEKLVERFSPEILGIPEVNSQEAVDALETIYQGHPLLGEDIPGAWKAVLYSEFHTTNHSHLFNREGKGMVLYEGKLINQFDHQFQPPNYWMETHLAEADELNRWCRATKDLTFRPDKFDFQHYRACFRNIAASTNERAFISSLLHPQTVCPHTMLIVRRLVPHPESGKPMESIKAGESLFLSTLFNAFTVDFVIRQKITTHLDMHFVYTLPIPRLGRGDPRDGRYFWPLVYRALRLVCVTEAYADLWAEVFPQAVTEADPELLRWEPGDYGPPEEREIRRQLQVEAETLTAQWSPECGVHDRMEDRRDTGNRAQLRAEIDALVAHLYGLTRDQLTHILNTFPGLEKKEKKAFGEYRSKRKVLEECERISL